MELVWFGLLLLFFVVPYEWHPLVSLCGEGDDWEEWERDDLRSNFGICWFFLAELGIKPIHNDYFKWTWDTLEVVL